MDPGKEEEEEKKEIPQGVLSQLLQLERRCRGGAVARELRERLRERRELLESRIRELRQRRERLRERLLQGAAAAPEPREALEWKIRNLRERLRLFQLGGLSAHVSPPCVSFSLHAACEGSMEVSELHPCTLELWECPKGSGQWRLRRHFVPPWAPLGRLCRELLPGHPRELLGTLLGHLRAAGARRKQLRNLEEEFPECLLGIPSRNSLCNLVCLRYRIPGKSSEFRARLRYGNALRSLPTDVGVSAAGGAAAPPEHAEIFRSLALPQAMRKIRELQGGTG